MFWKKTHTLYVKYFPGHGSCNICKRPCSAMQLKQAIVHLKQYILVQFFHFCKFNACFSLQTVCHLTQPEINKHAVVQLEMQMYNSVHKIWHGFLWIANIVLNHFELNKWCKYQPPAVSGLSTWRTSRRHQIKSFKFISQIMPFFTKHGWIKIKIDDVTTYKHTYTHCGSRKIQTGRSSHCHTATGR